MDLRQLARSTTFRSSLVVACVFAVFVIAVFGFVYWKIDTYLITRSDGVITAQVAGLAELSPERRLEAIAERLRQDIRRVQIAGLFDSDGRRITGNIASLPPGLKIDGSAQDATVDRFDENGRQSQVVRAIARHLPSGDVVVVGRNVDEVRELGEVVGEALVLGLFPALCLCLAAGALLSVHAERRIASVNQQVQRIVAGDLHERLPHRTSEDPVSKLAMIVNGMLDEMEALISALAGVGNDIAHDLRTPLTRARLILERGRTNATTLEELQTATDKATSAIDQSLTIVTALLRLAEIESSRRTAGFGKVALADLVREVGDMYEPIAQDKGITLHIRPPDETVVNGDRDLLIEAVANLVDNSVKFTPEGGRVEIALVRQGDESVLRVKDTGPGINEEEREAVFRRFYRSNKIRNTPGAGLGLNLVAAIVRLHGFRFTIVPGPGCVVEIACPHEFQS
jgi:signal transduction histidine kinase